MSQAYSMRVIARIHSDFSSKFGVPRQSGLVDALESTVVFEPEFRNADALRGLEGFSHLWLVWVFDQAIRETWSPTVRPPRLGGNQRMGVFATRSPFRPNPIALSCVRLAGIQQTAEVGTVLPPDLLKLVPENRREALRGVLAQDPRPHYQDDPDRVYGFGFAGMEVKFAVDGTQLTVTDIRKAD